MKSKKKIVTGAIVIVLVTVFLVTNVYTSSPGFVSIEEMEIFYADLPTCYGIDIVLNEKAAWTDAPGRSVCIGILR